MKGGRRLLQIIRYEYQHEDYSLPQCLNGTRSIAGSVELQFYPQCTVSL